MSLRAWLFLIALSLIWGAAFTFAGAAVKELGFITVVFLRVSLGALALSVILAFQGTLFRINGQLLLAFLLMGLLNNAIPFSLLFWAQSPLAGGDIPKVSSGLASVFNATTPIFSMLVAHFIAREEKISPRKLIGIGLGILGVLVLFLGQAVPEVAPEVTADALPQYAAFLGMSACVLAAMSYGFGVVFGRKFARMGLKPTQGAFGQVLGSSLIMLPLVLIIDQPWQSPAPSGIFWVSILGLAIASTAVAYMIYFWLIEHAGAVNAALVTLLVPASAMVLGAIFLSERFGIYDFSGLALILLGLLVIDGRILNTRAN